MAEDVLDRVRALAPTTASLAGEWSVANDDEVLGEIFEADRAGVLPLHFVPVRPPRRTRWGRMLPVAASVAVLAIAMGGVVALLPGRGEDAPAGRVARPVFEPPAGLSAQPEAGPGEFVHQVTEQLQIDARGTVVKNSDFGMVMDDYVRADGRVISRRTGQQTGCFAFDGPISANIDEPDRALFASLPTDVDRLNGYVRSHVSGSSSRDEGVFTTVGDALREVGAFASPRVRAALVAVLSLTPGVTLHRDQTDYLGRPALRLDFVDQRLNPGSVSALYFDPTDFRLLEERSASNGEPTRYAGPSPAYGGHGETGTDPEQLAYPASISLIREVTVVRQAPTRC